MYKKRYTSKRRYGIKKRKRTTKRSSKYARRQQKSAMTWIRKKYTRVFDIDTETGQDNFFKTVSLIGAVNSADPGNTITLASVNQDAQLGTDMRLYQFFRIRGVAIKAFFPMPTDTQSSPI